MAVDNTPPRLRLIATIGVISIITLLGIQVALESYWGYMTEAARREKIAPTLDKEEAVKAAAAAFAGAKVPIDQAMKQLDGKRPELVEPAPSDDVAPMTGWTKLPKQLPAGVVVKPPAAADGGAAMTDAGAASTDGGSVAADAGSGPGPSAGGAGATLDAGAPAHH